MAVLSKLPVFACAVLLPVLALAEPSDEGWREVSADNLAVIELDGGQVFVELNPVFAPQTVAQFKHLVSEGFYDGQSFYRVIDGFVAQGGDGSDIGEPSEEPAIRAEFERDWSDDMQFTAVQKPDLFAPETGFVDGFPAARDMEPSRIWLIHCPGTVAMARGNDPDSSRTDFYIVIGQAPRYLDRNLTIFGRVVYGMEHVQGVRRGPPEKSGIIDDTERRSIIRSVRMAAELAAPERARVEVLGSNSDEFRKMLESRRHRDADFFFHKPPPVLDVCQVPNSGRVLQ
jgi:peptidylprolyl isomerase